MPVHFDILLFVVGVLAGWLAYAAWHYRQRAGGLALTGMMSSVALWSFAHLAEHYTGGTVSVFFDKIGFASFAPLGFLWLAFVVGYTGRPKSLTQHLIAVLFIWPASLAAIVLASGTSRVLNAVWLQIESEQGLVFWSHVGISFAIFFIGSAILLFHLRASLSLVRKQGLKILAGMTAAWIASVVSLFELGGELHLHALPLGFATMGGFFLWVIRDEGLSQIAPIAREEVFQTMESGVVVMDSDQRIASINEGAREQLDIDGTAVSRFIDDVVSDESALLEWLTPLTSFTETRAQTASIGDSTLKCELSPLYDHQDRFLGAVLLVNDVSDQQRQQELLREKNEQLAEFSSVVSHDLRNPLNVAMARVELEQDRLGEESEHLDAARDALERMGALIDDLRTLARQGQAIGETSPVRLSPLCERAWRMVEAEDANLSVEGDLTVMADADRVLQLLENLFRNAIEHGGADVSVRVGAIHDEGFYIADDGPGIPEEKRDEIFESGYSMAADGTGFGLAIVAEIVEAHGWQIQVCESEVGGARFEILDVELAADDTEPAS